MDLLAEMKQCKTMEECSECATVVANGDDEAVTGWNEVC